MILVDPVATHGRARRDTDALVDLDSGRRWTWGAFDAAVNRSAHWLIDLLGPASDARVATLARNCADMLILQFACVRAGAIFVPLNWRLAGPEVDALIADATPSILLCTADFARAGSIDLAELDRMCAAFPKTPPPTDARRGWDDTATLLYTSGTSGKPKGVMVSEANAFWGATNFLLGNGVSADSVFLCDMPLFHTAGLYANARTPIVAGATLLVSSGFDPVPTLARLSDPALGITHYFSVPQMASMMWNTPGFRPEMLQALQVYATGGAPNPRAQIERFVAAGIPMSDGFGMTETCSNFGMPVGDRARLVEKAGSCGLPYAALECRIVDDNDTDVAPGDVGELLVRGPVVTQGYWNQPEVTAVAFAGDWFRTGDAARCDADGFYYIVDRKKDMFISGGENVYPAEVEAALAELLQIAEVAVVGIADEKWGEVGCAHIVRVPGHALEEADVVAHCRARLARFKVPARIVFADALPRTGSGKVQKHLLC